MEARGQKVLSRAASGLKGYNESCWSWTPFFMNYIAEICRARRIPFISASTVDAWRAASATIDRIHGSEEARRAALVVATILDPDVPDVRALFGDAVAALVGVLAPRSPWDLNSRAAQWARIASQGDTAGQAAIALLAAECSTAVEKRDEEVLRGFLDILQAHASAPASVRDEARQLRDQIAAIEAPAAAAIPRRRALISMSIDMAGSTEAKTRMRALAANDDRRHEFYRTLYREFLRHEDRFYGALFSQNWRLGCVLDWQRLFVVKGIGDEIWILYEVDPATDQQVVSAAVRLIDASLALVGESIGWHGTEAIIGTNDDFGGGSSATLRSNGPRL